MNIKLKKSHIAAMHDIFMAAASYLVSMDLRLGGNLTEVSDFLIPSTLLFTGVCACVFSLLGLYRGVWRYASVQDLIALTKAVTLAILIFLPAMFFITRLEDFPRSVLIINWMVLLAFLGGPRFIYRVIKDKAIFFDFEDSKDKRIPVLLAGISDNAIHFLRDSKRKDSSEYRVVGIVDENAGNIGRQILGVKVIGGVDMTAKVIGKLKKKGKAPRRIIIGSEHPTGALVRHLFKVAEAEGLTLAKLPKITDFKDSIDKIEVRPVAIEDLLGRAQKAPNLGCREELIKGRKVLVTGAGGTIGSELVRQIAGYDPAEIIVLEISEFNLYQIDGELTANFPDICRKSLIGDVRDVKFLDSVFEREKPDLVFHAAALKHVPIVEENLTEAVLTNVMGSKNVADMCIKHKAKKMVMISTDKAVNPTSLMGVTKRIAECYIQGLAASNKEGNTEFATVRFGNVLGSSGSVIPLFQKQLANNGPITVTHPEMTRYFMTVPEAVELVLQASTIESKAKDNKGAIFVLDMGEPVRIKDLAEQMIRLAGLRPGIDIEIKYTGIRPGEKLYEELFYNNEESEETLYEGIRLAEARNIDFEHLVYRLEEINNICVEREDEKLLTQLVNIVPEYNNIKEEEHAA